MGRLTLRFLGSPEVHSDGRPLAFPTRKALALLIYLSAEGGTHARDKIIALLWPDSQARSTLRSTLAMLRDALGQAASQIVADRDSLHFAFGPEVDLDLHTLDTAWRAARQRPSQTGSARLKLRDQLTTAAALYRGDFLEGFSLADAPEFDDWAGLQREAWHRRAASVFDALAQLQSESGEVTGAIETASRWAALDPLNEVAHRRLMLCHFTAGDRSAALQAYDACCALLRRELNVKPAPETESLAQRVRTQAPPSHTPAIKPSAQSVHEAPLVGRAREHLELVAAQRLAQQGQPQVVLIEGEPGIGKTRLANEFLTWAAAQGAEVLQGRAFEMGAQIPYQAIVDALRSIIGGKAPKPRMLGESENSSSLPRLSQSLSSIWLAELTRLLPELHEHYPDLSAPLPLAETESRSRLFEAVVRTGQALAEQALAKAFVLFIDDLQWADAASLDLLAYSARRWAATRTPALLVLAIRSEDMAQLNDWLTNLRRDLALTRLSLELLSFDESLQLMKAVGAEAALSRAVLSRVGQQVFADTRGHPFFIIQTLKSFSESGEPEWRPHASLPIGIRDLIRSRLSRLAPNALTLCAAGAVLGAGFHFDQVCLVAGADESDSLPAVEELLRRGLWRETGASEVSSAPTYVFAHDWIREVAYADLSEARRRILHRRALEAANSPLADLARHALAAGLLDRAFELSLTAGDEAMQALAVRNAIAYYEQAAVLLANFQPVQSSFQLLYLKLGQVYELASQWESARRAFEQLLALARESHASDLEVMALTRLSAIAAVSANDLQASATLLQEARQVAEAHGHKASLIEIEINLAEMGMYRWNAAEVMAHGERGLALARELGQVDLIARCLNRLMYAGMASGRWEMAESKAREARGLYARLGHRLAEAECQALLGAILCQTERFRDGIGEVQAAYQVCRALENEWGKANSAYHLAFGLCEVGEYAQALAVARAGVAAARASGHAPPLVFNLIALGRIYREVCALDEARAAHMEAVTLSQRLQHPLLIEGAAGELCADWVLVGNWAEALPYARQAVAVREVDPTIKMYVSLNVWATTEALLRGTRNDVSRAIQDVERYGERAEHKRRYRIRYLRALAALAQARGDKEQAMGHLHEGASIAEELDLPGERWPIHVGLGEMDRAVEIIQSLAAKIDDEQLRMGFASAVSTLTGVEGLA